MGTFFFLFLIQFAERSNRKSDAGIWTQGRCMDNVPQWSSLSLFLRNFILLKRLIVMDKTILAFEPH